VTTGLEMKQRSEKYMKEGFDTWMSMPVTRALISQIPAGTANPELLEVILFSAYEFGFGTGGASLAMEAFKAMAEKKYDSR
jgi:hypothetical protein